MSRNLQQTFRVPKKTNRQILELLKEETDQKQFLQLKLMESFKKPDISKNNMKFIEFWSIKNTDSEINYTKRRQALKLNNQNVTEYFGFYFINNETELQQLAKQGQIKVGNVPDSKLATGSMGVSLSQFSDIFHSGDNNNCVPTSGILLIIKYLKGKVNYVQYDDHPTDPQPGYCCHIVRNGSQLEINPTIKKAFHSTQVFLYEYTEDIDIVDYPTQMMMIGAVKFKWTKNYLFRNKTSKASNTKVPLLRTHENVAVNEKLISTSTNYISAFSRFTKPNLINEFVPLISGDIIMGNATKNEMNINVMLMTKFKEPIQLHNLRTSSWNLSEVIPNQHFFEFFNYMDVSNITKVVKINPTRVTQFPPKFYNGKTVPVDGKPKHLMYLKMVPGSIKDKKPFFRLIDNLKNTSTIGRITSSFFPDVLFYIFPSGKMSDKLGIIRGDNSSLHVLLLFTVYPEIGSSHVSFKDEYTFVTLINTYYSELGKEKKPLVVYETLKQTVKDQSILLKDLFKTLLAKQTFNIPSINKDVTHNGSDMEFDTDMETDESSIEPSKKRRKIDPSNIDNTNLPVDKDYRQYTASIPKVIETPIRKPVTIPSVIEYTDPSQWVRTAILETDDIESSPTHHNPSDKIIFQATSTLPTNLSQSQPSQNQSQNIIPTRPETWNSNQTIAPRHISEEVVNVSFNNTEMHNIPNNVSVYNNDHIKMNIMENNIRQPGDRYIFENQSQMLMPSKDIVVNNPIHNPENPTQHSLLSAVTPPVNALLPTPIPITPKYHVPKIISPYKYEPNGHFKLISIQRNYVRSTHGKVMGPVHIRSMNLMPEYNYISIYKG